MLQSFFAGKSVTPIVDCLVALQDKRGRHFRVRRANFVDIIVVFAGRLEL